MFSKTPAVADLNIIADFEGGRTRNRCRFGPDSGYSADGGVANDQELARRLLHFMATRAPLRFATARSPNGTQSCIWCERPSRDAGCVDRKHSITSRGPLTAILTIRITRRNALVCLPTTRQSRVPWPQSFASIRSSGPPTSNVLVFR